MAACAGPRSDDVSSRHAPLLALLRSLLALLRSLFALPTWSRTWTGKATCQVQAGPIGAVAARSLT